MANSSLNPPEESAEDLYENAPFGYISFLADGTIFKINQTLSDLLGFEKEEILQVKKIQSLFRIGGKIYFETHFFPLIKMQGYVKEINFDLVRKDGSSFPALINVNQLSSPHSKINSYRASVIDVTDRNKYEKVLLENKEKAEKASRAKAEFLSTISHEIRTPLNAIVGIGDLLQKTPLDEKQKEYARILQLSSHNLLELVNNLLDLSKLEAQKVKLEKRSFSLHDLIEVLVHAFKIKAAEKNIQLKTFIPENLPDYVLGDPVKLNQVLTNLIGNSIKFTRNGHVELRIEIADSYENKVRLEFAILDTGIGIPQDKLEAIFQEFSQASYDVNLEFGGTGLGLTISQKLLQMYGSELQVESEEGKGSKFSFVLEYELSKEAPVKKDDSKAKEVVQAGGAKVLVVDDNPTNLFVISQYLQEWNLEYRTVNSGPAAIEALKEQDFDIVLMDLHMPKMNGYETSATIHKLELEVEPVIVALSASGRGDIDVKMKRAGISAYVPKPFDPGELKEKIISFLRDGKREKPVDEIDLVNNFSEEKSFSKSSIKKEKEPFDLSRLIPLSRKNPEILKKLIDNSLKSIEKYRKEFLFAANKATLKELGELVHKNTMTLHYIQAERLAEMVDIYKELAQNPEENQEDIKKKKKEVLVEFDRIITGLKSVKPEDFI